jgi:phosphonopyruvate decarboxylase
MIQPSFFIDLLKEQDLDFYTGVPDSLLKSICAYITDHFDEDSHIIAANEGNAVGLAAGYHLATGKIPVVYMQNSGLGNTVNPIASLIDEDVYHIPLLLLVGWRGEPGIKDEPQHIKQGKITLPLLETMGIENMILSDKEEIASLQIKDAVSYIKRYNKPFAFVVRKETFDNYTLQNKIPDKYTLSREEAIKLVASNLEEDDVIISTTGMISRELFEYRAKGEQGHQRDFLTVGSMGHASQIALGIALQDKRRKIYCFDGDGALLMHTGSLAIIGARKPENFFHFIFNNGAHDSVGGQPTVAFGMDISSMAKAMGYTETYSVEDKNELTKTLEIIKNKKGPVLVEIKVKKGNRPDLGRPTTTPIENKKSLMNFLKKR